MSPEVEAPLIAAGLDVGSSSVKLALVRDEGQGRADVLHVACERLRRRDPSEVADSLYGEGLVAAGLRPDQLGYVATTGEGELIPFRTGHFYGMTTHARGAVLLDSQVRSVLDVGALHARGVIVDERAKVLGSRMTSQCASGSGQFLENISRYLGVAMDGDRSAVAGGRRARGVLLDLRRPGRDRRDQHGLARDQRRRTSSRASTSRWPAASSSC